MGTSKNLRIERTTRWERFASKVGKIGGFFSQRVNYAGNVAVFSLSTIFWLLAKGPRRDSLTSCFYNIGAMSVPVILLTGSFIGMVLAVQAYPQFKAVGLETHIGAAINLSLVKELGPVLAATMIAGRVGSSIAAELGTMRVTEQIDALSSMGVNPIHYLVVPRFLSCLILVPGLTLFADLMGIVGGAYFGIFLLNVDWSYYWEWSRGAVSLFDIFAGMFKTIFFGASIALICCHQGFRCGAGAEGVGKAATNSFVLSFVSILFLDLLLDVFLDHAQMWLTGAKPGSVV